MGRAIFMLTVALLSSPSNAGAVATAFSRLVRRSANTW
jgi:hypothetical protein